MHISYLYRIRLKRLYIKEMDKLIQTFSIKTVADFFKKAISSFKNEEEDLDYIIEDKNFDQFSELTRIGNVEFKNSDELIVFACKYNGILSERSSKKKQFEIAKLVLKEERKDAGIAVFYDDTGKFRFSFIRRNWDGKADKKYSSWKRFTYFVNPEEHNKTFRQRIGNCTFKDLDSIQEAFSVEKLTKEFYNDLFKWYQWTLTAEVGITFPNDTATSDDDRIKLEEQMIRLITRLLFVWFIKQKHLVPDELFKTDKLSEILKDFDPNNTSDGSYYNAILQNLFFATLNKAVTEREFAKTKNRDIKTRYRYAEMFTISEEEVLNLFRPIPFLNGGLFECLDKEESTDGIKYHLDGFSRSDKKSPNGNFKHRAFIPNAVFFGDGINEGLIPLLERYNFTVEENVPNEVQVALDPELLGNVFENLLGAFNPETQESARKQSGSFYTPKEIVAYMVDESLISYLQSKFSDLEEALIRQLFEQDELPAFFAQNHALCEEIASQLRKVKILDPACGSGAFPMGILNRMVEILEKLDTKNKETHHDLKLHLIEECIYGVDIQTIASQISKLRFFISLIVEQETMDLSKPEENYGVLTLPNLETKFVAANTLIGMKSKPAQLTIFDKEEIENTKQELLKVRKEHFYAKSASAKKKLRDQDAELRDKLAKLLKESGEYAPEDAIQFSQWNPYDQNATSPFFDPEWMFGLEEGFDVVIGNPPYIKEYTNKSAFDGIRNTKYYKGKMDIWYAFSCIAIDILKNKGHVCFIAQNNWITSNGASILRDKILKETQIKLFVDFGDFKVFESAGIQTMIFLLEKTKPKQEYSLKYSLLKDDKITKFQLNDFLRLNTANGYSEKFSFNMVSSNYVGKTINFNHSIIEKILQKVENKGTFKLDKNEIAQGIVAPQDFVNEKSRKILNSDIKKGSGVFVLSEEELLNIDLSEEEKEIIKPYYTSEQLGRYCTEKKNTHWIIYTNSEFKNPNKINDYPAIKLHLDKFAKIITSDNKPYGLHRSRDEKFFKNEKIMSLRKCTSPTFTFTDFDCYVSQSYFVIQTDKIDMKFLTLLLNSNLMSFWFRYKGKMQGQIFQIDKEPLLSVPILQPENIQIFISLFDKIQNNQDISVIQKQIDILIYKLYELTFEEVQLIDNSILLNDFQSN